MEWRLPRGDAVAPDRYKPKERETDRERIMHSSRREFRECNDVLELVGRAMAHCMFRLFAKSMAFVADEGDDHAVQVEEEHQEVEAQLDERFL